MASENVLTVGEFFLKSITFGEGFFLGGRDVHTRGDLLVSGRRSQF